MNNKIESTGDDNFPYGSYDHGGDPQYVRSETKIPHFSNFKVDGDFMTIGGSINAKVGQHIMIGNNMFKVGSIVNGAICLQQLGKKQHHRRIKLPMEV